MVTSLLWLVIRTSIYGHGREARTCSQTQTKQVSYMEDICKARSGLLPYDLLGVSIIANLVVVQKLQESLGEVVIQLLGLLAPRA